MTGYPIRIENGLGETLTFNRVVATPSGDRLEGYNEVEPGAGPPMHVHWKQEEGFSVVAGRLGYQIHGQQPQYAEVGESVVFPVWADGKEQLRCTGYVLAAGNTVYFLSEVFRSTRENGGRPNAFDAAYLLHKYRSEYGLLDIPGFVIRVVFPVLRLVGALIGRFKKYEPGPTPL